MSWRFKAWRERTTERTAHWIARRLPPRVLTWAVVTATVRTHDEYPADARVGDVLKELEA